jgi:hypothetical protein
VRDVLVPEYVYTEKGARPIKRVYTNSAAVGEVTVVSAVAGKRIRVLGIALNKTSTPVLFLDGPAGATLFQLGYTLPTEAFFMPPYWLFQTGEGKALVRSTAAGTGLRGWVFYVEV